MGEEQSSTDVAPGHADSTPTPRTHVDSTPLPTDSLVTISLSEASRLSSSTTGLENTVLAVPEVDISEDTKRHPSIDIISGAHDDIRASQTPDNVTRSGRRQSAGWTRSTSSGASGRSKARSQSISDRSDRSIEVDWEELDKTEEREDADAESDEATALLLARLEQENNALASDPKSGQTKRSNTQSRPPSLYQLRKIVQEKGPRSVRFSLLPSAAPMTEMDFWMALVQDYRGTAQRLPTLTSNKIRSGIPLPLRGVVWVSTAGARDAKLEEQFEKLSTESSPYETIINKDIGRSFPGVDMFKDPEGEGQQMLGRVLKCYSLYDKEIGYCQGLGFLVGPLLMNMGDKEAFCVLVRLMEDYDLRSCFLPDLSGLHLRIYQFQKLLQQHVPALAAHLNHLQIEGAYLSQWFLSFFAITCPLPLLFRIYDVIFVEGASETLMRVALAIMCRNEKRLLSFAEFEDAMQLLLSRGLWDPYGMSATSADELVNDFCSFTGVVTRESLQALETGFREAQNTGSTGALSFLPSVQAAASRFLGRTLWNSNSHVQPRSQSTLSPGSAGSGNGSSRPTSMLLRTPSKQSISTLYSAEGSSDASSSTASTAMTEASAPSRESTADYASIKSVKSPTEVDRSTKSTLSNKDKDLHQQVEDLLMVLSEMQREHAILVTQLQKEREDRNEDNLAVRTLVNQLKQEMATQNPKAERRKTVSDVGLIPDLLSDKVRQMVENVHERVTPKTHSRKPSGYETKAQLRGNLASVREQLHIEKTRVQDLSRELTEKQLEAASAKDELQKARARIKDGHLQQQRLEKTILELRQAQRQQRSSSSHTSRSTSGASTPDESSAPPLYRTDTAPPESGATKGLREFKLVRSLSDRQKQPHRALNHTSSTPSFSKRTSSLVASAVMSAEQADDPQEALLQELVAAKTNEAMARQELEELRVRFESMRKAMGITTPSSGTPSSSGAPLGHVESAPASTGAYNVDHDAAWKPQQLPINTVEKDRTKSPESASVKSASSWTGVTGSFWGWGGRRTASTTHAAVSE